MGQSKRRKLIELSENLVRSTNQTKLKRFRFEPLTEQQRYAWDAFQNSDVLFLIGAAGTGKTFLAIAFALYSIFEKKQEKIILSRPVVEAGENLGFLPGDVNEKVYPYMLPLYDSVEKMCGKDGEESRKYINNRIELAPLAFLRGRTFSNAICLLDEAQNCTEAQLKLWLTRLGKNSKMIITGDPTQSDLGGNDLMRVVKNMKGINGISTIYFDEETIVRHPLIAQILRRFKTFEQS